MKTMFRRILAACDGSPESEEAFAAMLPLLRTGNPDVLVVYVFENPHASYNPPAQLAKTCAALRANGVQARLQTLEGKPAAEIVRLAKERDADLIVMSTQGRGGLRRLLMGSVAEAVIRTSDIPVLVARPGTAAGDWKRMVVALDGSTRGEDILQDVIPLAERLKASVELIRVALPPMTIGGLGDAPGAMVADDPLPYLKQLQSRLAGEGFDAAVKALDGRAAAEIVRHATESGASLLCLTTHGRTGLERVLMGSVAEEVVRNAPCPVLLRRSARVDGILLGPPAAGLPAEKERVQP